MRRFSEAACKKKLKVLKDKMREVCSKLPKTSSGYPAFEKGEYIVRWPFYRAMLFMKDQFIGKEVQWPTQDSMIDEVPMMDSDTSADQHYPILMPSVTKFSFSPEYQPACVDPIKKKLENDIPDVPSRAAKRPHFTEEFLDAERVTPPNFGRSQPHDEWAAFCDAIACDLRKLKDPFLINKTKSDLYRVVNEAVYCQLTSNISDAPGGTTFTFAPRLASPNGQ